ncbi:MAG: Ig-like domain-containing protein [Bacteroidota bacterium]|nr:Ig-like domain-containing protein [Bacteroidota bacterium]
MKHYLHSLIKIFIFSFLAIIVFFSGCKENVEQTNGSIISTRDELTDPNVTPEVIWTFPSNNSTGPFSTFNTNSYHFIVQFNKLMNLNTFNTSTIKITGFNTKINFSIYDGGYSTQQFQNVIKFYIRDATNGNYINFEIGKTYTVEIDSTVEDIHGKRLLRKHTFTFTPEPSLRVRYVNPANGDSVTFSDYYYSTNVYLSFNSALTFASLSSLHISPTVSGKWTIDQYNPSTTYFIPTIGFNFSTQYQISADQNLTDKYGNKLSQPFISTFTTGKFKVVTTSPSDGAENVYISSGNSIYITFSGSVDPTSVASAFTITPSIQGNVYASGSQLYFNTTEQLTPGTKYTVILGTTLKSKNGTPLSEPYMFSFTTEEFRVNNTEPYQGYSGVSPYSQIRFSFNAPINQASAVSAFSIEPAVTGNFSFVNYDNRTFTYTPTQPFKYGTRYTVTLSTSMKSTGGSALKEPYELQFTTTPFQVTSTTPSNNDNYSTANYISVWFTGDLDTGTVRNSFSITPATAGSFSFYSNQFSFVPSKPFLAGQNYSVTLSTGIKGKDGSSLQSPYSFSFTTQAFQITNISPYNGSTDVSRYSSIYVNTNYTVDQTSISAAFSISPAAVGNLYTSGNGFYFTPQNQLSANTSYSFTVSTKLKSTNGDTLLVGQTSTFKTGS